MTSARKLNIVNEDGAIIGEATREEIHKKGLLHREVHVWFYTPRGELIFQHRAKNKDTYPNLLDATVGGHVEIGNDYESTALKELEEETGIRAVNKSLILITMMKNNSYDPLTGNTNNVIDAVYAYRYDGNVNDLKIGKGKAIGFEVWSFEKIFCINDHEKSRFVPRILGEEIVRILHVIQKME